MASSRRSLDASNVKLLKSQDSNLFNCSVDSPNSCSSKTSECSSAQSSELNIAKHFVNQRDFISHLEVTQSLDSLKQEDDMNIINEDLSLSYSLTPLSENTHLNKICFNSGSSSDSLSSKEKQKRRKSEGNKRKSNDALNFPINSKKLCIDSKSVKLAINLSSKSFREASGNEEKDLLKCQWVDCMQEVPFSELLDHLLVTHIKSQQPKKRSVKEQLKFACRWVGCKVFNKPSTLLSWLEKHVICHLGNKPYRCIVDNCGLRFTSQCMLNRHINRHFTSSLPPVKKGEWNKKGNKGGIVGKHGKFSKRKARKMNTRNTEAKDIFDSPTMNCIQQHMTNLSSSTLLATKSSGMLATLTSKVIGERLDQNNQLSFLIQWFPPNSLPDEWVSEAHLSSKRSIHLPFSSLSPTTLQRLMTKSFP